MGCQFVFFPVLAWLCKLVHLPGPGELDSSALVPLVTVLLGHVALGVTESVMHRRERGRGQRDRADPSDKDRADDTVMGPPVRDGDGARGRGRPLVDRREHGSGRDVHPGGGAGDQG
jgi:hypothetical protein